LVKPNADLIKRAMLHAATLDWQVSPMARVEPDYRHRGLLCAASGHAGAVPSEPPAFQLIELR
jgi:hypothetical protein